MSISLKIVQLAFLLFFSVSILLNTDQFVYQDYLNLHGFKVNISILPINSITSKLCHCGNNFKMINVIFYVILVTLLMSGFKVIREGAGGGREEGRPKLPCPGRRNHKNARS